MYVGFGQFSTIQTKIQRLAVLSHEYASIKGDALEEIAQDQDLDAQGSEDSDFEPVVVISEDGAKEDMPVVPKSDCKKIEVMKPSSDDDFVMLSREEERILSKTKADLARYRKKIAQQRSAKRAQVRAKRNVVPSKKKSQKKKAVSKKKSSSGRTRIPTMNQIKRRKATNAFFDWPVDLSLFWLSSVYGPRKHPRGGKRFHYGIDLAALRGTPVMAAASGTVIQAGAVPGYGNNIIIKHKDGYKTRYAHLHKIYVKKGQKVKQGQKIAAVGATGYVRKSGRDASHLHFEIYSNGSHVNPLKYLLNE